MLIGGVEYTSNNNLSPVGQEIYNQTGGALLFGSVTEEANAPDSNIAVYFDVINSHQIEINDSITDNWLENSTVVNDCIAQNPIIITLSGISGELIYTPSMNNGWLRDIYGAINDKLAGKFSSDYVITDKLTVIPELFPPVDNITQMAKNAVTVVENNVKRYEKIVNNFLKNKEQRSESRLRSVYKSLTELRNNCKASGEGLTVETPYGELTNMFIQSISLSQDNQAHITDISVTLKQVNFSDVEYPKADKNVLAEFNAAARAEVENHGKVQGKQVNSNSAMYNLFTPNLDYVNLQ